MKNGIPFAYATYRVVWSIVHISLMLLFIISILVWLGTDNQGSTLVSNVWSSLTAMQQAVANALPFPWGG